MDHTTEGKKKAASHCTFAFHCLMLLQLYSQLIVTATLILWYFVFFLLSGNNENIIPMLFSKCSHCIYLFTTVWHTKQEKIKTLRNQVLFYHQNQTAQLNLLCYSFSLFVKLIHFINCLVPSKSFSLPSVLKDQGSWRNEVHSLLKVGVFCTFKKVKISCG